MNTNIKTKNPSVLLLDLELTLIQSWEEPDWLEENANKIKNFINSQNFDSFGLFSLAVWEDKDVVKFNSFLRPIIEKELGINFDDMWILTKTKIIQKVRQNTKLAFFGQDINDFDFFLQKDHLLTFLILNNAWPNTNITLIDDTVKNCNLILDNSTTNIININNL